MPRGRRGHLSLGVILLLLGVACGTVYSYSLPQSTLPEIPPVLPFLTPSPLATFSIPTPLPTATTTPTPAPPTPTPTLTPLPTATPFLPLDVVRKTPPPSTTVLGHGIDLPPDFKVDVFAKGIDSASCMAYSPDGVLFVSLPGKGAVVALPDVDGNGQADQVVTFAQSLVQPKGLAFHGDALYVAEAHQVVRFHYQAGALTASAAGEVVVPDLPVGAGHATHVIGFGPDDKLYVAIGSSCNACQEIDYRRATIMRYNADGSEGEVYAQGLRDVEGLCWYPSSQQLLASNCSRRRMGDDLPPDTIEMVRQGANYGWPFCHAGNIVDPELGSEESCKGVPRPFLQLPAQSTPGGLCVYTGSQFPQEYYGDIFVTCYGSWERMVPVGYKVVRINIENGQIAGMEDFATGWLVYEQSWGRPTDVIQGSDGSLLVSDDQAGAIIRIYR